MQTLHTTVVLVLTVGESFASEFFADGSMAAIVIILASRA